jgi:hypothetical protein
MISAFALLLALSPAAAFRAPALQTHFSAALHSKCTSPLFAPMLETARLCGDKPSLRVDAGRTQFLSLKMNAPGDWNKLEVISNTKAAEGHQRILLSGGVVYPTYSVPGSQVLIPVSPDYQDP